MKGLDLAIVLKEQFWMKKNLVFYMKMKKSCHFMDQTNFEQIAISKSLLGEKKQIVKRKHGGKCPFL